MPRITRRIATVGLAILIAGASTAAGPRASRNKTALDRYVYRPDPAYKYELVDTIKGADFTVFVLDMTSQEWRRPNEVNRTRWQHWVVIVRPDEVKTSTGLLLIDGGSNGRPAPRSLNLALTMVARSAKAVVAAVRQVPNEPLTFKDETRSRTEDEIIAYSWDKFLRTGDETWPLRLPMTKAAVRAMDTVTSFCEANGGVKVDKFIVAGGSKRGWTTWTTAAVDDRVIAIAPFVIDVLNGEKSMEHHYRSYGFWAPALGDYVEMKLMDWAGTPQYRALMAIEDPYSYRNRLLMPKLITNATGDQYFLPDSSQFYFDGLEGEKHLRYVPNAKHDLNGSDALLTLQAFCESILGGTPRPRYSWSFGKDGSITALVQDEPLEVRLWQATNPKARDFRLDSIGKAFTSTFVEPDANGRYSALVGAPSEGWTAYFLELTFPGPGKTPFKFTSGVRITPDKLPSPPPPRSRPGTRGK